MPESSVPVEFLFHIDAGTVTIGPQMIIGGPQGSRMIASVSGGTFEGPKMKGAVPADVNGAMTLKTAPTFETGDERYQWLNRVQAVGYGTVDESGVHDDVYALR